MMRWVRGNRAVLTLAVLAGMWLVTATEVRAQEEKWSYVLTLQIWGSHIGQNGFVAGSPNTIFFTEGAPSPSGGLGSASVDSSPEQALNPQFGLQFAAQYGRWILAGAAQYVHFTTENDVTVSRSGQFCYTFAQACVFTSVLPEGTRLFTESVTTDRIDVDLALSYFWPDVVKDVLDISTGIGLKFIYANSDREIGDVESQIQSPGFLYCTGTVCGRDPALRGDKTKVGTDDYWYGITFPMSFIFQLSRDKKWLLPFNVSPFLGAETRDDQGTVYEVNNPGRTARSIDGTTFAFGVTSDLTLRYIFDNGISPYFGFRVQYLNGHETFLAWGPLAGVSFRFGGP
jgi:hypothetical protein